MNIEREISELLKDSLKSALSIESSTTPNFKRKYEDVTNKYEDIANKYFILLLKYKELMDENNNLKNKCKILEEKGDDCKIKKY